MFGKKKPEKQKEAQTTQSPELQALQRGTNSIPDIIAPSSVEVDFNSIRVGEKLYKKIRQFKLLIINDQSKKNHSQ
jgi:hypothetical protein